VIQKRLWLKLKKLSWKSTLERCQVQDGLRELERIPSGGGFVVAVVVVVADANIKIFMRRRSRSLLSTPVAL
jgi:hypothetical protein